MEKVDATPSDLFTQEPCANPSCTNKMRVLDGEGTFAVEPGWRWYSSRPGTGFKPVCSQNCQRTYRDLQDLT